MGRCRIAGRLLDGALVTAWFLSVACDGASVPPAAGDGGVAGDDASANADAGTIGIEPAPPLSPSPPRLACPPGWWSRNLDGVIACEPYTFARQPCEGAMMQLPGEAACRPIGSPCPSGAFPDDLPTDRPLLYVRADADPDGDGSQERPFAGIRSAIAATRDPATVIAVAKGRYAEPWFAAGSVEVRGACAGETIIETPPMTATTTISVLGGDVALRDLSITGPARGIELSGGTLELRGVFIDDTWERGIRISNGAHLVADELVVRGVDGSGVGQNGEGLIVDRSGSAVVRRSSFDRNHGINVLVIGEAASLDIAESTIIDTMPVVSSGRYGYGLAAWMGSQVTMDAMVFDGNGAVAILVSSNASAQLVRSLVRDTVGAPNEAAGAMVVQDGATADVSETLFERSVAVAFHAVGDGTTANLRDIIVLDALARPADRGFGIGATLGAHLIGERLWIDGSRAGAILVHGGIASLSDVQIRNVRGRTLDDRQGRGLSVQAGGSVQLERATITGAREGGVGVLGVGTSIEARDLEVRDGFGEASDGRFGWGVLVEAGSIASFARSRMTNNREIGMGAGGAGVVLDLSDVLITGTLQRACPGDCEAGRELGIGLRAYDSAAIEATRFGVADNAFVGVQIASGASIDLADGYVTGQPIGVSIQTEAYDVARLMNRVHYDNDRNLDARDLPLARETPLEELVPPEAVR